MPGLARPSPFRKYRKVVKITNIYNDYGQFIYLYLIKRNRISYHRLIVDAQFDFDISLQIDTHFMTMVKWKQHET